MPLHVFLGIYFLTTVFANVLYTTPIGRSWPSLSITGFSWDSLSVKFGFEYWLLLLSPLAVVPAVSLLSRSVMHRSITAVAAFTVDFPKRAYTVINAALYVYVIHALYDVGAARLMVSGTDAIRAVDARFEVLDRLGFWPQMVMQSLLVFFAVYAVVTATRQGGWFWYLAVLWHVTILSTCLILLNMKWPVVLFVVTLGLCVLVVARRFAILKSGAVLALGAATYLLISVVLLRLVPAPPPADVTTGTQPPGATRTEPTSSSSPPGVSGRQPVDAPAPGTVTADPEYLGQVLVQSREHSSTLLIQAVNRMAMAAPYYYSVFSLEGQVCGTITDRIVRKPSPCQPSTLIYTRMFGADGFEGRATAPAAVNITAYALGGWLGVIVALVLTGLAIGGFLSLWSAAQQSNMIATVFVMGGYAAYFWTQLPFEAAFVYSHGILWWAALVFGYSTVARIYPRLVRLTLEPAR